MKRRTVFRSLMVCPFVLLIVLAAEEAASSQSKAPDKPAKIEEALEVGGITGSFSDLPAYIISGPSNTFQTWGPVLEISGLYPSHDDGTGIRYAARMERPEKPEGVKITLFTQDGKRWVAKWEEAK